VGEASAVLGGWRRIAAAVALCLLLLAYGRWAMSFPDLSDWGDVFWIGIVLGGVLFGLLWLALPLALRSRLWLGGAAAVCIAIAVVATLVGLAGIANLAKLGAAAAIGFLFVSWIEFPSWLVVIALVIPFADTISVWKGPTHYIVTKQPGAFTADSVAFPAPGERVVLLRWRTLPEDGRTFTLTTCRVGASACAHRTHSTVTGTSFDVLTNAEISYRMALTGRGGTTAIAVAPHARHGTATGAPRITSVATRNAEDRLGLTDVLFFAVFLAGSVRFRLRPGWTWVGLVLGFAASGAAGLWDPFGIGGVPALPFLSLGFLLPNADLLWGSLRTGWSSAERS
jgi:hypothetical protein